MNILAKMKETAVSVLPVMAIVLFLGFTFVPLDKFLLARFVVGGLLLIVGLTIFLLGVDLGIQPMGERCGAELTKKRSLVLLLIVAFIIGFIVTRKLISKYLKKNPPINEQMIKVMMSQMGRTPTQKQINQMMKAMNNIK